MKNVSIFALGLMAAFTIMILMGASSKTDQVGRYQISAWAAYKADSVRHGYYVLDTTTGEVINSRSK